MAKHFTAPQAYIMINGVATGIMKNVNFSETIDRTRVQGIGSAKLIETPVVLHTGTFSADMYFIDFFQEDIKQFVNRRITGNDGQDPVQLFLNSEVLGDSPISLEVYKKEIVSSEGGVVTEVNNTGKEIIAIRNIYITSQNLVINEGSLSASNVTGLYLDPAIFVS